MRMLSHKFTAPDNEEDDGERDPIRRGRYCNGHGDTSPGILALILRSTSKITVNYIVTNCILS